MKNYLIHPIHGMHTSPTHQYIPRISAVTLLLLLFMLTACGGKADKKTSRGVDSTNLVSAQGNTHPADEIWLTAEQERLVELATDTAQMRMLGEELVLNGLLEVPPQYYARLHAPIPAFVKSVRIKEGEKVSRGQVLMWLEHPDALELQRSYLENSARLTFLEAETDRQEILAQRQATDRRTLEQTRADHQSVLAQRASIIAQLQRLHIDPALLNPRQLSSEFPVKAPFSGYVTVVNAFPGQFTERTGELAGVLDLSHMHVELDLPETHLPFVQPKMPFTFSLTRLPHEVFDAEVYSIGRELNKEHRTVRVHGHIKREQDPILRPGMSVLARLPVKADPRLSVASGALLQTGDGWVAFQKLAPGRYRRVPMSGAFVAGSFDVLGQGIEAGTVWVTSGAGRLDAQSSAEKE